MSLTTGLPLFTNDAMKTDVHDHQWQSGNLNPGILDITGEIQVFQEATEIDPEYGSGGL